MAKFKTDFDPTEVPDQPKDDVYVCHLYQDKIEVTPEPSEKGYYMAQIRNVIDEGLFEGEIIWDRIIVRHVTGQDIPMMAKRRMKKFCKATGAKVVNLPDGKKGIEVPEGVKYGVENRNDSYGPKANDYFTMEEIGSKQRSATSRDIEEPAPKAEKAETKAEPEVSFEEFE